MSKRVVVRRVLGQWVWTCYLCCPPVQGCCQQWQRVIRTSLPYHFRARFCHHKWAAARYEDS